MPLRIDHFDVVENQVGRGQDPIRRRSASRASSPARSVAESSRPKTSRAPAGLPHPRTVTRLNRLGARPVGTVAYLDFPTSLGSRKVPEIRADARVTLFFVDLETRDHATLYGQAELLAAANLRRKYHQEHGFEGRWPSPTDHDYLIIRVHLVRGEFLGAASEVTTEAGPRPGPG